MKRGTLENYAAGDLKRRNNREELQIRGDSGATADVHGAAAGGSSGSDDDGSGLGHPLFQIEEKGGLGGERRIVLFEAQAAVRRPVGKIIFTLQCGTTVAHVDNIWVADGLRGLGFGRLLLHQCVATLAELGASKITLEAEEDTRRHNHLVGLYRSEGFAQFGDDSFVKFIPHNDGCFRKVPMCASVAHCLVRSRLFEQDQVLYVRVLRKPAVALGLVGKDHQLALLRDQGSGTSGGSKNERTGGDWGGEGDDDDDNDGEGGDPAPHMPKQWWLLNRHDVGGDSDDENGHSSSGGGNSSSGSGGGSSSGSGGGVAVSLQHTESACFLAALPSGRVAVQRDESGTEDWAVVPLSAAHASGLSVGAGGNSGGCSSSLGSGSSGSSSSSSSSGSGRGLAGFYALRASHGGYLGFGLADGQLSCGHLEPSAWRLTPARELEWRGPLLCCSPLEHAKQSRLHQTWAYATRMRRKHCDVANSPEAFGQRPGSRLSVKDVLQRLLGFHHPRRPDTELSVGSFALLCAEIARAQGQPDWMQLVLLLHACGELRAHGPGWMAAAPREASTRRLLSASPALLPTPVAGAEELPWALCPQETWLVGCALPASLPFAHLNALSPDADHPTLGSPDGVYMPGQCSLTAELPGLGLETLAFHAAAMHVEEAAGGGAAAGEPAVAPLDGSVVLCWGPHEYMYHLLRHNQCSAPWEALAALRLSPLKCWHTPPGGPSAPPAYARLLGAGGHGALGARDAAARPWAQMFDETVRGARAEARQLHPGKAPQLADLWPHYNPIVDKYLPNRLLEW
jgi:GNAT superfamily N-acetyltransferase